jgi:hypothetical protein
MLKALYGGKINAVDPFVCMLAEPHRAGSDMGELQHAVLADVFTKVRDGDRRGRSPTLPHLVTQSWIRYL